jgi:hypothetical protein
MRNCKEFHIPTDWILDNGIISKVNLIICHFLSHYLLLIWFYNSKSMKPFKILYIELSDLS